MLDHETTSTIAPEHATALVEAARSVQSEARSFGEDVNEGYMLLHAALADALRRRDEADPAKLAAALRSLARAKTSVEPEDEAAA
jgi:hypothetical protein